ncbi:MAG: ribonuclease H-like domain-containing protein [Bacteriodetes bacterium]|nr:ribonuclease H-like domain-containing protein [Bacteroidota bacterium]
MEYLVIDIETSPIPFDHFDDARQEYLLRGTSSEEEQEKKKGEMALSPLTGYIVCIGMLHYTKSPDGTYTETKKVCLVRDVNDSADMHREELPSGVVMVRYSEHQLVSDFWKYLKTHLDQGKKSHFITFNGRGFDFPFLMLRSAVLGIRPSINLMNGTRWSYRDQHTDLMDELTYFNPQNSGATRRYNFDFFTKSFGVTSPKAAGIDGSKVSTFYQAEDYATIAEYCLRDVKATWELYLKWVELLKF